MWKKLILKQNLDVAAVEDLRHVLMDNRFVDHELFEHDQQCHLVPILLMRSAQKMHEVAD